MKMVRTASFLTLMTLTAIAIYVNGNTKKILENTTIKYAELTGRFKDIRSKLDELTEQIREHRARLAEIMDIAESHTAEKITDEIECV